MEIWRLHPSLAVSPLYYNRVGKVVYLPTELFTQVEISKGYAVSDWRDDVKRCLLGAGLKNKPTTFLFR